MAKEAASDAAFLALGLFREFVPEQLEEEYKMKSTRSFNLKDMMIGYGSLVLICISVLIILLVSDVISVRQLFSLQDPLKMFFCVLGGSLGLILFGIILSLIIPEKQIDEANKNYKDNSIGALILFMSFAGLFEELLFRGILQNLLLLLLEESWQAVLVTSVLFCGIHISYFKKPIMLLNIFIPSIVFGWLYVATNNLIIPVTVHIMMNLVMTLLFKFKVITLKKS